MKLIAVLLMLSTSVFSANLKCSLEENYTLEVNVDLKTCFSNPRSKTSELTIRDHNQTVVLEKLTACDFYYNVQAGKANGAIVKMPYVEFIFNDGEGNFVDMNNDFSVATSFGAAASVINTDALGFSEKFSLMKQCNYNAFMSEFMKAAGIGQKKESTK